MRHFCEDFLAFFFDPKIPGEKVKHDLGKKKQGLKIPNLDVIPKDSQSNRSRFGMRDGECSSGVVLIQVEAMFHIWSSP